VPGRETGEERVGVLAAGLVGLVVGFLTGRVTERTRRARVDYQVGRKAVPVLKKAAFANLEKAVRIWVLVGIAVAAVVIYLVKGQAS
jgi:hypothetical protein